MNVSWTLHCNERISLTCQVSHCVYVGYLCACFSQEQRKKKKKNTSAKTELDVDHDDDHSPARPDWLLFSTGTDLMCEPCSPCSRCFKRGSWMEDAGGENMMHKADAEILGVLFAAQRGLQEKAIDFPIMFSACAPQHTLVSTIFMKATKRKWKEGEAGSIRTHHRSL